MLLIAGLTAGCGAVRGSSITPPSASQRLDDADTLARTGRYTEAWEAYAAILAENGVGADRALLGLARLALDPNNPKKDEGQAAVYVDRLVSEYPQSSGAADARTWRSLLQRVDRLQREVRRQQQELERLRRDLQREQQETARLRDERERLREIDLELERPLRMPNQSPVRYSPE